MKKTEKRATRDPLVQGLLRVPFCLWTMTVTYGRVIVAIAMTQVIQKSLSDYLYVLFPKAGREMSQMRTVSFQNGS